MRLLSFVLLASCAAVPARAAWFEARSDHFIVYAQGRAETARDQAVELERYDRGMRFIRSLPDDPTAKVNPLTVYVLSDTDAVQKLCKQANKSNCANVAGFYEGHAEGPVAFTNRQSGAGEYDITGRIVLFHEYAHHIMFRYFAAAYPAWYAEGFAEFNSTAHLDKEGRLRFGSPAQHRAYSLVLGEQMPVRKLLTARGPELSNAQREQLYARGWLLCHYLSFAKERDGQLSRYLKQVANGTASLTAAQDVFGDLGKLDRELDHYLQQRKMMTLALDPSVTSPGEVTVRALSPGETAMMPVRMRSKRGVDEATAAIVVKDARQIAAGFPADPGVQDALTEAEFDAGDDAAAEAAADRALAAAPGDRVAMLYKGRVHVRRAARAKQADPKAWQEARTWFVKANRLQPDDAVPLALFYGSFLAQGIKPTANAVMGLEQAQALAPQDQELRMLLGRQMLTDGRKREARIVLAPLAFDPHAPADNPAATLIAMIDKGDDTALAGALVGATSP